MRKIILAILGILLIIAAYFGAKAIADSKSTPRAKIEKAVKTVFVDTVRNKVVPILVPANGNLVARQRLELFAEVQGVFLPSNKLFRPGQRYRKGEAIIRINSSEYAASVQSAKSNLYNQITSVMPDLRLDYPDIYPKWAAYLQSFDLENSTPKLPTLDSDQEKFFITGRGILTSYYNVKNLEQRLSKYSIRAPYNGVLTEALVTEGTLVRGGQKLGEFINTDRYELEVALSKKFSDLLQVGRQVELTNLEKTQTYTGTVSRINSKVEQASQTVKAFIDVSHPDLKEGMYLEANLMARDETNALQIDRSLLLENDKIFVVRDSILDLIDVTPVYFTDENVVLKGVPEGLTIISKPVVGAYAGMLVKIYQENTSKTQ
ncbi:MAG: HlyD family efflux transporter periplasmic adaptor subunit [Bacteroidia bacterium]|nr:HlyD family efflux transporter periplasmic adaptor subunit [Bacteroidia bacterium]